MSKAKSEAKSEAKATAAKAGPRFGEVVGERLVRDEHGRERAIPVVEASIGSGKARTVRPEHDAEVTAEAEPADEQ